MRRLPLPLFPKIGDVMMRKPSLVLATLLLACVSAPSAIAQNAFTTTADGATLVHTQSGTQFPKELAGFTRTGEAALDPGGEYVGVGYQKALADGSPVTLRIAIVHVADTSAEQHFIIARPMVLKDLTDVTTLSEGAYRRGGKDADGYMGIYNAREGDRRIGVALLTLDRGYWDLRGRVEFPTGRRDDAQVAVDAFIDAFIALGQPYKVPAP